MTPLQYERFISSASGQFAPVSGGQFESANDAQFKSVGSGQFHRFFHLMLIHFKITRLC
jgi:hypothetical protein